MPCISTSHGPQVNRSRHPYQYVTSHISMRHVTHIKVSVVLRGAQRKQNANSKHVPLSIYILEACRTYQWAMSKTGNEWYVPRVALHVSTSRDAQVNQSRCTYQYLVLRISIRHVAPINTSRCTYQCVTLHISTSRGAHAHQSRCTHQYVTLHISIRHVAHKISHVAHINKSRCTHQYVMLHIPVSVSCLWVVYVVYISMSYVL